MTYLFNRFGRMAKRQLWAMFLFVVVNGLWVSGIAWSQTTAERPFRITLVVFRGCEEACKGFTDYFKNGNTPVEIEILDANLEVAKLDDFAKQIKAKKPDLLVTWGTTVSLRLLGTTTKVDAAKHITDIPALFMIASTPVASGLVESLQSPGRNVSGTSYIVPVETQLGATQLYLPFKKIGFLLNGTEDNSKSVLKELQAAQQKFNFTLEVRNVPLTPSGKPDSAELADLVDELAQAKCDFLYFAPDTFLLLNRDRITREAIKRKLPVVATSESVVTESEGLLGVVNRYYTVGQLTAAKAEMILVDKVSPKDIPVVAPPNFALIVNMRVAAALKLYPPINVLKVAQIVK
jgi:putative ABC transport system substrate-binding protein